MIKKKSQGETDQEATWAATADALQQMAAINQAAYS